MPANLLLPADTRWTVPPEAQVVDRGVAENYEKFDGLAPLDHPSGQPGVEGSRSRPGGWPTEDVYTPGPLAGLTNTLGGQPLPVADPIHRPPGHAEFVHLSYMQFRLGVGQNYQGVAQTVALGEITSNPPQPGDLSSILAGWG